MLLQHYFKKQKGKNNPNIHQKINEKQVWHLHTMEYYSAFKRNETLIHTTIWINLKNSMLSEIIQTQNDKQCIIPLI